MKNKIIEINGKKYKRVEVNETPLWEQELDENWFSDLSAKAKQAYIKTNPNSKQAEKKASSARQAVFSKQRSRARGNSDDQYPF